MNKMLLWCVFLRYFTKALASAREIEKGHGSLLTSHTFLYDRTKTMQQKAQKLPSFKAYLQAIHNKCLLACTQAILKQRVPMCIAADRPSLPRNHNMHQSLKMSKRWGGTEWKGVASHPHNMQTEEREWTLFLVLTYPWQ